MDDDQKNRLYELFKKFMFDSHPDLNLNASMTLWDLFRAVELLGWCFEAMKLEGNIERNKRNVNRRKKKSRKRTA